MKKGSKLYSIFKAKCPRCHEGDFFRYNFTFNPSRITKLHKHCPKCNLKYMLEPSFFYGAMYINYGITVAIAVTVFVITSVFLDFELLESFLWVVVALLILAPFNLRLARILWINMFVSFKKDAIKKTS